MVHSHSPARHNRDGLYHHRTAVTLSSHRRGKSGSIGDIVARHERMLEETMAALEQRALQSQVAAIADEVRLEAKASLEAVSACACAAYVGRVR